MGAQALLTKCVFNCPICFHLNDCENALCLSLSERDLFMVCYYRRADFKMFVTI